MKIRFIYPKFNKFLQEYPDLREKLEKYIVGDYTMPPSLAIPTLSAITPKEHEVFLTDDNIGQPIDYSEKIDLVAISCFTPQAERAYAIADEYRKHGTTVAIGGIHPSLFPDEAALHADAVCIGEGEPIWESLLNDLKAGTLKKVYQASDVYDLANYPIPRRDIFSPDLYKWNAHLVLTMRGCPVRCSGCPIPVKEGVGLRFRPVDNIVNDIKSMSFQEFYFTDDTLMLPGKRYEKFLLKIMEKTAPLNVKIFLASTMMMYDKYEYYTALKKGGASSIYTIFGFDRVSVNLFSPECTQEEWDRCVNLVRMIEDNGIHFFGSFGIGFDDQDRGVVDRILKFCKDAKIDLAEFYIITPFPGTPFGIQIEKENRILHRNYSQWNHGNVVFEPKNWTKDELIADFKRLWLEFYENVEAEKTIRSFNINDEI